MSKNPKNEGKLMKITKFLRTHFSYRTPPVAASKNIRIDKCDSNFVISTNDLKSIAK